MSDDSLTSERAAEIAREHGLTLSDALALRGLTDSITEAERMAANFAGDKPDMGARMRETARTQRARKLRGGLS